MSSETITRNDLTNILNEVLTASSGMSVEDISDKITFTGAWSNYMRKAYLIGGKFVFFTLEGYAGTIMQGTQYTIATIASGYRPKDNLAFTGHATNANYLPQSTVNCYVWTSGDITVRCSNANGNYVFVSGWYALAEGSAPVIVADYIVEQGTSGYWIYRKWNSGIAECWWKKDISVSGSSVNLSNYIDFPFTFMEQPIITTGLKAGGIDAYRFHTETTTTTQVRLILINTYSGTVTMTPQMYVVGKWK